MLRRLLSVVALLTFVAGSALPVAAQDRTVGDKVDDAAITAKVKTKLTADRAKNVVNVNVDTKDGIVHLQGTVPKVADKVEAERLARSVSGVRDVKNDLLTAEVGTGSSPSASPSKK